ncbi:diguanylate cyclase [Celerinatantimonas sp. MCCC 1A17872]|uniref:sensor domain-containing diguanylate cyclase n=1 Tax=Celerinatantimonas sp. MCCC 1A17872 TaxID=3177514 RepID=UPI0038CB2478
MLALVNRCRSSTAGEIIGSNVNDDTIVISVSIFENTIAETFYFDQSDLAICAKQIGKLFSSHQPNVALIFCNAISDHEFIKNSALIKSLSKENKNVLIAGGQAGIAHQLVDTYVFTEQVVSNKGCVVALLKGESLQSWAYHNNGWIPIGRKMQVTCSKGHRVHAIDDKSIKELYKHYLGADIDLTDFIHPALQFPLVREEDGVLSVPVKEYDDGSFEFTGCLAKGTTVRFSFCDIVHLESEAKRIKAELQSHEPEALYVYSCGARKKLLGKKVSIDIRNLDDIASTAGFFTSTEFFTSPDLKTHCLIQNMTLLGLSEQPSLGRLKDIETECVDEADDSSNQINEIRILTTLIAQTSKELEESNRQLAQMARMDNMTGLYNRNYFDLFLKTELKRHQRSNMPISLILLDVDYFKQFNDVYGHVAGDHCLAKVGEIIRNTLKRTMDIGFRYGGEEMGGVLPNTDFKGATIVAETIRQAIEEADIAHSASLVAPYVTVSIGYLTITLTDDFMPEQQRVIDMCDQLLYQAKTKGRNRIIGKCMNFKNKS